MYVPGTDDKTHETVIFIKSFDSAFIVRILMYLSLSSGTGPLALRQMSGIGSLTTSFSLGLAEIFKLYECIES